MLENVEALKEKWRLERVRRERKKKIHLVLAIITMVAIAVAVVGIKVGVAEVGGCTNRNKKISVGAIFPFAIHDNQSSKNTNISGEFHGTFTFSHFQLSSG